MKKRTRKKTLMTPDLTPLIDVVFLLLIFFMLVTTFDKYSGFKIELPTANLETDAPENNYELIIDAKQKYHLKFGEKVEEITLLDFSSKFVNVEEVTISADKNLTYETIVKAINELKNANVEKVGLNLNE